MNILVCDDLKEDADNLAAMLGSAGFDTTVIIFTDARKALDYVQSGAEVDCCFLDIIMQKGGTFDPMGLGAPSQGGTAHPRCGDTAGLGAPSPEMNGIELAEKLRAGRFPGEIVFLTSSNDFAHQSYQVNAYDYLLKPPTREKVQNILHTLENERKNIDQKGLMIKIQGRSIFILYRNISHVEVVSRTVYIRLKNGDEIKIYSTLADISPRLLSDNRFMQCHRSYIVNVNNIESVTDKQIVMQNGAKVPISRGFSQVMEEMVERIFAKDM